MKFSSELTKHLHRSQLSPSTSFHLFGAVFHKPALCPYLFAKPSIQSFSFGTKLVEVRLVSGLCWYFSVLRFARAYKAYHLLMSTVLIWRPTQSKNVPSKISRKKSILLKDISASFRAFGSEPLVLQVIFERKISRKMKLNLVYEKFATSLTR